MTNEKMKILIKRLDSLISSSADDRFLGLPSLLCDDLRLIGHRFVFFVFGAVISKGCLEDFEVLNYNQEAFRG